MVVHGFRGIRTAFAKFPWITAPAYQLEQVEDITEPACLQVAATERLL
jgi:hypothetical protein